MATQTLSLSPLSGSARPRSAATRLLSPVDPNDKIAVTLVIRLPPGCPPIPDLAHWSNTPLNKRRFLSHTEYADVYSAAPADLDAVRAFATAHHLEVLDSHAARRTVSVLGTAAQLNAAFNVTLNHYEAPLPHEPLRHASGLNRHRVVGTYVHRSFDGHVHVPPELADIVIAVVGLDNRTLGGPSGSGDPPGSASLSVPTIASHYNFPNTGASDQTIGIHGAQRTPGKGSSYIASDINTTYFQSLPAAYNTPPSNINDINLTVGTNTFSNNTADVLAINNSTDFNVFPTNWIIEVIQDISTSATIAQGANVNVYFTELSEQGWLVFLNRVLIPEGEKQPTVVSSSFWSWASDDPGSIGAVNTPGTAANLMSSLFQQLALLGINVFVTAGDYGASAGVLDGKAHLQYAGSDPWATSCGGTIIGQSPGSPGVWEEWVWSDANSATGGFGSATTDFGATGGGVSANFPVPAYQTAAGITQVTDSNNNVLTGRFVPDVAAMVACNGFVVHGMNYWFTGTSCVAPLYAGLFATLRSTFKRSLGFLNPILYQLANLAFNDVTKGNNDSADKPPCPFFNAGIGYDACTGLGSIDGTKMLNGIASLLYNRSFYFVMEKSTFGMDEVANVSSYPNVFSIALEGFHPNSVPSGGPTLSGAFKNASNVTTTVGIAQPEIQNQPFLPQRVLFPCQVVFAPAAIKPTSQGGLFPSPGSPPIQMLLVAEITVSGQTFIASTVIELVAGADPYFTNISPSQNNVFYLSQDLRVFTACPGINATPISGGPQLSTPNVTTQSTSAGYQYIQDLLAFLNSNYTNPGGTDPFISLFPNQFGALIGDSSVTPSQVNPSNPFGAKLTNYNFAVARVRLNGTPNSSSVKPVKVFFRLWTATSCDTNFDPNGTYLSTTDNAGHPTAPSVGTGTIPFFATGNYVGNADFAANVDYSTTTGPNNKVIQIGSGGATWAYYGCFLNIYALNNFVNGKTINGQLGGTHHCLVAQIAFDDTLIVNSNGVTENPQNSDKLAQRNLQITLSDNPGPPSTHRIPQAFDVRPSPPPISAEAGELLNYPDELMIDWGNTPIGSRASIYWPAVQASDVLALAQELYSTHQLSAADENTIRCTVPMGKTYVPIPTSGNKAGGESFAGLFTIDLPAGVVRDEIFDVVVRRIATRRAAEEEPPPPTISIRGAKAGAVTATTTSNWRYVVGSFGVRIPVSTASVILPTEEDTLAILKWRLGEMGEDDRWHPVLQRYVAYVSARVEGLGGHPGSIKPSPGGVTRRRRHHGGLWEVCSLLCCCDCL